MRFWATAGLTMILATWGHRVSGYLHPCPCHPLRPDKDANRERAKQRDRFWFQDVMSKPGCELPHSRQDGGHPCFRLCTACSRNLKCAGIPAALRNSLDELNSFGNDNDGGTYLMSNFQAAKSRLMFRMAQSFGYCAFHGLC